MYVDNNTGYEYQCELCKNQVNKEIILKCEICGRKLCNNCDKAGICLDHYNFLSDEGKKEYNKYMAKFNKYDNKFFIFYGMLVIIFALLLLSLILLAAIGSLSGIVIVSIILGTLCFLSIVVYIYLNKKMKLFKVEKFRIYKEYCTNLDEK